MAEDMPLLVSTAWVEERLGEPDLRVFDCTGVLVEDPERIFRSESGRARYEEGHVPGAGYLDLHEELSDPDGRHLYALPSEERFAEAASRHGVGPGTRVVLYSAVRPSWATRVWWLLRLFGFDAVAVMDGGWEAWAAEGRPVSREPEAYPPSRFEPRFRPGLLAGKAEVAAAVGDGSTCTLNALAPGQLSGAADVHYGRPGRIPGSVNQPYLDLLAPGATSFLPAGEVRSRLEAAGALRAERVVAYCGGGIGATALAFALALAGRRDAAVYDGSMLEWAADPSLPVQTGA